jgi:hypothetical protein
MLVINRSIPGGTFEIVRDGGRLAAATDFLMLIKVLADEYNETISLRENDDNDKIEQLDELKEVFKRLLK